MKGETFGGSTVGGFWPLRSFSQTCRWETLTHECFLWLWHMNGNPMWVPRHLFPLARLPSAYFFSFPFEFCSHQSGTPITFRLSASPTVTSRSPGKDSHLDCLGRDQEVASPDWRQLVHLFTHWPVWAPNSSFLSSFWLQWRETPVSEGIGAGDNVMILPTPPLGPGGAWVVKSHQAMALRSRRWPWWNALPGARLSEPGALRTVGVGRPRRGQGWRVGV